VQASAKHGKHHDIFVPAGRWIRWRNFLLLERPELVTASAKTYFASIPARAPRSVNSLPCKPQEETCVERTLSSHRASRASS
jgi:hypothetical protein